MDFPENYVVLSENECEYLCGGGDANVALLGIGFVGGSVCSIASSLYRSSISKKLREEDPEKYGQESKESVKNLLGELLKRYFTSAAGVVITLGSVASLGCIVVGTVMGYRAPTVTLPKPDPSIKNPADQRYGY